MKSSIKRVLDNLIKKCASALEIYVLCKIIEKAIDRVMDENKDAAIEEYQRLKLKLKDDEPEVFECRLKKYTSPKKYEYSDEVKLLEVKLKSLKKQEEQNSTAKLISESTSGFSVSI